MTTLQEVLKGKFTILPLAAQEKPKLSSIYTQKHCLVSVVLTEQPRAHPDL